MKRIIGLVQQVLLTGMFLVSFSFVCFAQESSPQTIEALSQNPKINNPQQVLRDFKDGKTVTRVIVNLRKTPGFEHTQNLQDMEVRRQLPAVINAVQEKVISAVNPDQVRVTNRFRYIFGFSAEVTVQGLLELSNNSDVLSIDNDKILHPHLKQGIPLMNATTVRSDYNGEGMAIAICDTGIDFTHPMLGGAGFPNNKVIGGYDCGENDTNPMDERGHGTCCSGIAAGDLGSVGDYIGGVAHKAKLYAVKISRADINHGAYTSDMIEGWEWCITHQNDDPSNPIMVISTSFGGGGYSSNCDNEATAMTQAAANANSAGITLFVSSGNDGYCTSTGWPACISHVVAVGAVYDADFGLYYPCVSGASCATKYSTLGCSTGWYAIDDTQADMVTSYSNTASFLGLLAPSNRAYTLDMVGGSGYAAGDYYSGFGGTSAACPYAAGAAACLQSAAKAKTGSFLSPSEVKTKLIDNGDPITDGKVDVTKPRVNLQKAVNSLTVDPCLLTISPTSLSFPGSGGTGTINVDTADGCNWEARYNLLGDEEWISVISGETGTGDGTVEYSVDVNPGNPRTGTIHIGSQDHTVFQSDGPCSYEISPTEVTHGARGGYGYIDVITTDSCIWTATSNVDWIEIVNGASGQGAGWVDYWFDATNISGSVIGTITVAGFTHTVTVPSGGGGGGSGGGGCFLSTTTP